MSNEISLRRKVTIYNTSAQNNKVLESAATTWGQLQVELAEIGVPYSGMRAVIGETQTELITNQSSLDPGDMTLFLMPRKVKSGINISEIVDPEYGVSFSEMDWADDDPEDYTFLTAQDAAQAFAARADYLRSEAARYSMKCRQILAAAPTILTGSRSELEEDEEVFLDDDFEEEATLETPTGTWVDTSQDSKPYPTDNDWGFELSTPLDPETERLKKQAEELQRNMQ